MHSWIDTDVPHLEGRGPVVHVFDSRTRTQQALPHDGTGKMYVCGITPYDATHMGHAATYVAFDVLNRAWRDSGAQVKYVQNVTDVDDPLIERALATNRDWQDIAVEQTALFHEDMKALRNIAPDHYIGAVESIDLVVERVSQMQTDGIAYYVDQDIYYDNSASNTSGEVAHLSREEMLTIFAERGGDPAREGKRDALDALLWKAERPHDPSWNTELGAGRPGWHIECAAIALYYLGDTIHVQGGGSDLKFPHHEMSAAHAHSTTGKDFAENFVHTGMVALDGEKMSKSKGNLVFVSKLRAAGVDPMAIRLTILAHHYQSDWEWFDRDLELGKARLAQWRLALSKSTGAEAIVNDIRSALGDNLNTPLALELIDQWAAATNDGSSSSDSSPESMRSAIDALLGVI